jgi:ABC-type Fe3+-hydroxamate transport system substrate-binding protein
MLPAPARAWKNEPVRLVSLCPSITESLAALGLADQLVGVTRYCVHPREALAGVTRVGGTKNPDIAAIRAAKPDLVLCNAEENRREDVEALAREFAVDVSFPKRVADVPALLRHFGRLTGRRADAEMWAARIEEELRGLESRSRSSFRYAYLIWRDPWMTVSGDTYVSDLFRRVGGRNAFEKKGAGTHDYPTVSELEVVEASPDLLVLPDEPYRFTEKDAAFWRGKLSAGPRIVLVKGDDFSWHGTRTLRGLAAAGQLARQLTESPA